MRNRIVELVAALRRHAVRISVAESMDAARAAAAVGVERDSLRHALASALVKDERDRPLFDQEFDRIFPSRPPGASRSGGRRALRRGGEGGADGDGEAAAGSAGARGSSGTSRAPGAAARGAGEPRAPRARRRDVFSPDTALRGGPPSAGGREGEPEDATAPGAANAGGAEPAGETRPPGADGPVDGGRGAHAGEGSRDDPRVAARQRERALLALPFRAMTARDVEAAAALVQALARRLRTRVRRRLRPRVRGRLDFRGTIRAAVPRGGVPFVRRWRGRRPARPRFVALCDLSGSTATATDFFLAILAPAAAELASVQLFGFVDHLVEIEFVDGQVRPAGPLDLMARSDFGRVLDELMRDAEASLTPNTVLLVLGDARNNRRPPRAELLAAARARVRRVLWLNPEPEARWNNGDSVMALYARHADAVVPCGSLAELDRALTAVARL